MAEYPVARADEFTELTPIFVETRGGFRVGVYKSRGEFFAYVDRCPHQGGPACEGIVVGDTKAEFSQDRRSVRRYVSESEFVIACPWHGIEFDLTSGICKSDERYRLVKCAVVLNGEEVSVRV